jgi:hypothetical protein
MNKETRTFTIPNTDTEDFVYMVCANYPTVTFAEKVKDFYTIFTVTGTEEELDEIEALT